MSIQYANKIAKFLRERKVTKRDVIISVVSIVGAIFLHSTIFSINKYIETKFFTKIKRDFTLNDTLKYFPISEGNTWTYYGVIKSPTVNSNGEIISKEFEDYKLTIVQVIDKGNMRAALVKRNYSLLGFLEDKKDDQRELWILVGGKYFIIHNDAKINSYLRELQKDNPVLVNFPQESLEWEFPLFVGKKYNFGTSLHSGGDWYSYKITEKKKISISGITNEKDCFKRELVTLPDEQSEWFCPGIGIVEHAYSHHGTPMSIDFRLREFYIK